MLNKERVNLLTYLTFRAKMRMMTQMMKLKVQFKNQIIITIKDLNIKKEVINTDNPNAEIKIVILIMDKRKLKKMKKMMNK